MEMCIRDSSQTGEYQKALEDQNTKAKELADKLADAREEAGKLGDIICLLYTSS